VYLPEAVRRRGQVRGAVLAWASVREPLWPCGPVRAAVRVTPRHGAGADASPGQQRERSQYDGAACDDQFGAVPGPGHLERAQGVAAQVSATAAFHGPLGGDQINRLAILPILW